MGKERRKMGSSDEQTRFNNKHNYVNKQALTYYALF